MPDDPLTTAGATPPTFPTDPSVASTDTSALGTGGPLTAAQPARPPSLKPGMPALISLIGQMIHPTAQVQPGQMPRQPSRLDAFENFLGNFAVSLASGMAASGHGPGANERGAAAAIMAPQQQNIAQFQMQQQAQEQQARIAQQQAQTQSTEEQAALVPVTLPDGTKIQLPANLAKTMIDAQTSAAARQNVATTQTGGRVQAAQITAKSREDIAAKSAAERWQEFQQGTAYKTWKTKFDAANQQKIAQMRIDAQKSMQNLQQNKAPAAIMQTAVFAGSGLKMMDEADAAMQRLEQRGVMGSLPANKVQDWIFGKGLVDPSLDKETRNDIGKLRAALGYTSSAAMVAHTRRTSNEIFNDFKSRLGPGQDWAALRGAMEETRSLLNGYVTAASDASIQSIRQGTNLDGGAPAASSGGRRVIDLTK